MAEGKLKLIPSGKIEETLKTWSDGRKLLVWALTVLIIVGGYWYFFYKDTKKEVHKLERQIRDAKSRLAKLKVAKKKSQKLQKKLIAAQEELKNLLETLPEAREIPSFLQYIADIGATSGLSQLLFEPQREEVRDFYAVIPVKLKLVGDYHRFGLFLDRLSKLDRLVRVRSVSIGRKGKGGTAIKVDMVLETYRYLQQSEIEARKKGKKGRRR